METTTVTDPQSGETICNNCGMVIAENIQDDARPEWRSFGLEHDNNNKSRIGNPLTLVDMICDYLLSSVTLSVYHPLVMHT